MRGKLRASLLLATTLLTVACSDKDSRPATLPKVQVEAVVSADGATAPQYPGRVEASQDASLAFRVSGTIARYCVEEGTAVSTGQLLVELDATDYSVQLDASEAEYHQVKAEAERVMALYADSVATANDNDRAVYGLQQATAKLRHHRDQLSYTRLYAPFAGTVQKHLFSRGETVAQGMPVISMVGGAPEVTVNIPASEYARLSATPGTVSGRCTLSVLPGEVYTLSLISMLPQANSNQLYTLRFALHADGRPAPTPGMSAMVTLLTPSAASSAERSSAEQPAAEQPASGSSLFILPLGAVGGDHVLVYDASTSTVHSKAVTLTAVSADGRCTVSSTELQPGDMVVTCGVHHLNDGEQVELLPATTASNIGGML